MTMASPLTRFVLKVLGWLPLAFAAWYFAAPLLVWPVGLAVDAATQGFFGDLVHQVIQEGSTITFVTTLKPGQATRSGNITVDVNTLLYTFGMPLFAALVVAAREPRWPRKLAIGYAVLLPAVAWGVLADFLKNVAITSGTFVAAQAGFPAWEREMIAFAYQFGSLILPTVVPAVTWVLLHRAFLERLKAGDAP
jgi:hypothetical protein